MNDEQFELAMFGFDDIGLSDGAAQLRARDAAQREALAQLQAEMPNLRANMTKALDLLQVLTSTKYTHRAFVEAVDEADGMLAQLRGKVVLKGLAEQQEAQEIGPLKGEFADAAEQAFREQYGLQEAQGAQAGDELIALLERELDRERERADMAEVELQNVRTALSTQSEPSQLPAAAAFVRNMATDYANEHGWDDMGGLSFGAGPQGTAKMEHFLFLEGLAEKLRTMATEGGVGHA